MTESDVILIDPFWGNLRRFDVDLFEKTKHLSVQFQASIWRDRHPELRDDINQKLTDVRNLLDSYSEAARSQAAA